MSVHPMHALSRRHLCLCAASTALAATGVWLTPDKAFAQARAIVLFIKDDAALADISVTRLRGNVTVLRGSGGNIAVLTGRDGTLLVDAGIGVSQDHIVRALATIQAPPIQHLINTHWHFDHTDGNEWVHAAGAAILAHENTLHRLSTAQRVEGWKTDFPPAAPGALPTQVFATQHDMKVNAASLALRYYGPAHTDGDISVRFTEANILHTGDTFWNNLYPFIDYSTGGSIDGTIRAAEANLAATDSQTIVIPGHGIIGDRADLKAYRDMLVTIHGRVAHLKAQGRTVDEIIAAKPTREFDARFGGFVIDPDFFTRMVCMGV